MPVNEFVIGIETEGFWKGKAGSNLPNSKVETKTFAEALVLCYNKIGKNMLRADFYHGSHPGHHEDPDNQKKWIVALDDAIGDLDLNIPGPEGYPLEFVSPKLSFGQNSRWREDVKKHWATLLQIGEVEVDKGCATHVHVSPEKEKFWSLEQLKRVAKAVIYFDDAFKSTWAPSRRQHELTQSNKRNNYKLKDLTFVACCERIEMCANKRELINLMQSGRSKAAQQTRDYAWNFENTEKAIGTIEFRCAPGVTTAIHCLIWVELGVSFVQAAAQFSTSRVLENEYEGDVEGLKKFILQAGVDGMNEKDLLAIVFQDQNDGKGWDEDDKMTDAFNQKIEDLQRSKPEPLRPWVELSSKG